MKYRITRFGYNRDLKKITRTETVEDDFIPPESEKFIDADLKCSTRHLYRPIYKDACEFMIKLTGEKSLFGIESIESEEFGSWKYIMFNRNESGSPRWSNGLKDMDDANTPRESNQGTYINVI